MRENSNLCKLFKLETPDRWEQIGMGFAGINSSTSRNFIEFQHEDPTLNQSTYKFEIVDEADYEHQDTRKICFYSFVQKSDYALSYEGNPACERLWDRISTIIDSLKAEKNQILFYQSINIPTEDTLEQALQSINVNQDMETRQMYIKVLASGAHQDALKNIFQTLETKLVNLPQIDSSKNAQLQDNYQTKYKDLLKKLQELSRLFKKIIEDGPIEVIETLFSSSFEEILFGTMEWDAELFGKMENKFRENLIEKSYMLNTANIESTEILKKIKLNYRLLFLRDSVLAQETNERLLSKVSSLVTANYHDIITYVLNNKKVLPTQFEKLREGELDSLKMINDICVVLKNNPVLVNLKDDIYSALNSYNIFEVLEHLIVRSDSTSRNKNQQFNKSSEIANLMNRDKKQNILSNLEKNSKPIEVFAIEIMIASVLHEPKYLKTFLSSGRQKLIKYPFFHFQLERMFFHEDEYVKSLYIELIKDLLDTQYNDIEEVKTEQTLQNSNVVAIFLDIISEKYDLIFCKSDEFLKVKQLKMSNTTESGTLCSPAFTIRSQTKSVIDLEKIMIDLFSCCIKVNNTSFYQFCKKTSFLNLIQNILAVKNKHLLLQILQFVKIIMLSKNEDLMGDSYFLLRKIFLILSNLKRKNLVYSSAFEIVNYSIKEKVKTVIEYFNKSMGDIMDSDFFREDMDNMRQAYVCILKNDPINIFRNVPSIVSRKLTKQRILSIDGDFLSNPNSPEVKMAYNNMEEGYTSYDNYYLGKRFAFEGQYNEYSDSFTMSNPLNLNQATMNDYIHAPLPVKKSMN